MFLVKAGSVIQVEVPKSQGEYFNWVTGRPYITKEDKIYDKEEVWDIYTINNGRDLPLWAHRNITEFNKVIIHRDGKFALVNPKDIQYLD